MNTEFLGRRAQINSAGWLLPENGLTISVTESMPDRQLYVAVLPVGMGEQSCIDAVLQLTLRGQVVQEFTGRIGIGQPPYWDSTQASNAGNAPGTNSAPGLPSFSVDCRTGVSDPANEFSFGILPQFCGQGPDAVQFDTLIDSTSDATGVHHLTVVCQPLHWMGRIDGVTLKIAFADNTLIGDGFPRVELYVGCKSSPVGGGQ